MPRLPKLQIPYPLPRSHRQLAIFDRYAQTGADECAFDVGWHVVGAFVVVAVERGVRFCGFGDDAVECVASGVCRVSGCVA